MKELPELFTKEDAQSAIDNKELSALGCSLVKWDKIREALKIINSCVNSGCGCCLEYTLCPACPLAKEGKGCCGGLYNEVMNGLSQMQETAEAIYEFIRDKRANTEGENE
jgi:hypothetical protein